LPTAAAIERERQDRQTYCVVVVVCNKKRNLEGAKQRSSRLVVLWVKKEGENEHNKTCFSQKTNKKGRKGRRKYWAKDEYSL
jgi:hypothetical protein